MGAGPQVIPVDGSPPPGAGAHPVQGEDGGTTLVQSGEGETLWLPANTWWEGRRKHNPSFAPGPNQHKGWDR